MMKAFIRRNGALGLVVFVSVIQTLYYVNAYSLLGPTARYYNDSDYQYVLSATYVLSGPQLPLFVHPGLSETFFLGLFFALLTKLSLLSAFSLTDFLHSQDPFDLMISLLNAGRAWSSLVGILYLVFVYICCVKLTRNRWLSALAVWANVFYVGLLEQAFVVRPEPLSVLFCLFVVTAYLSLKTRPDFRFAIPLFALSGILLSFAIFAKVLIILYLPLWLLMAWDVLHGEGELAKKDYWLSLGLLLLLAALLVFAWKDIFDLQNALAPFRARHHHRIATLRAWSLGIAGAVGLAFLGIALAAGWFESSSPSGRKCFARIRKAVVISLAFLCGALSSLFFYDLNLSPHHAAWAEKLVSTAMVETIAYSYLNVTRPVQLLDFLVGKEFRFMFTTMWGFLILFGLGVYFAERRRRTQLLSLFVLIWLFYCVFALRGGQVLLWSYQIYVMPVITLSIILSAQSVLLAKRSRIVSVSIAVAIAAGLVADSVHVFRYRAALFSAQRTTVDILTNVDFSERGNFTREALYPRFCEANHLPMNDCISRLAVLFDEAQSRRQDGRFHLRRR